MGKWTGGGWVVFVVMVFPFIVYNTPPECEKYLLEVTPKAVKEFLVRRRWWSAFNAEL